MKLQSKNDKVKKGIFIAFGIVAVALIAVVVFLLFGQSERIYEKNGKDIIKITIANLPDKTMYYVGEEFDPAGTKIQVITHDMQYTRYVGHENLTFSGFDSSAPAENQVITVSYQGFTTSFSVKIAERPSENPTLVDIEICDFKTNYTMTEWNAGGPSVVGATVKCLYSDESVVEGISLKTKWIYGAVKVDAPCTLDLTIKYNDNGTVIEKVVTVTITE